MSPHSLPSPPLSLLQTNGTFLIRDSETKADTLNLTLRHTDLIFHFRINRNVDGDYFITETDHFPTLWEVSVSGPPSLDCRQSHPESHQST